MIVLLALSLTALYLAMVGIVFIRVLRARLGACRGCHGVPGARRSYLDCDHDGAYIVAVLSAAIWPAAVFLVLPAVLADPHRGRLRAEAMRRRIEELEREAGIKS